jgi:hypothetical protein
MALAGANYEQIAKACGYRHRQSAMRAVREAIQEWAPIDPADAAALRDRELARLDRLQTAHWTNALRGDIPATDIVLKIMTRRARLLGLDAAVKVEATVSDEMDQQIQNLTQELERRAQGG